MPGDVESKDYAVTGLSRDGRFKVIATRSTLTVEEALYTFSRHELREIAGTFPKGRLDPLRAHRNRGSPSEDRSLLAAR
jgi:hypothetical protein